MADPDWVGQWLLCSVQPMSLWTLTSPLLPIGANLMTPFNIAVPILGIDGDGRTVVVLFDLRTEQPLTKILGESLLVLQWVEGLEEKQLEAFGRYFWHDPKASLASVWSQVHGIESREVSFGKQQQVQILSWRPKMVLWEIQSFLRRYGLSILFFGLHTFQGEQNEIVAIAEPILAKTKVEAVSPEEQSVRKVGDVETFLKFLEGMDKT